MDRPIHYIFWILTLLTPVNGVMLTMVFLIVVDFITGSYASYKMGISIDSKKIGHTISKFFIYNLVILSAFLLESFIVDEVPFLKVIAGFIAVAEIKSILENYNRIYGVNPFTGLTKFLKLTGLKETLDEIEKDKNQTNKKENNE